MSTDRKEIESLMKRLEEANAGARVTAITRLGQIESVRVLGVSGFGPHGMSPLSFAEQAREWLFRDHGRRAYEADVKRRPSYADGAARKAWRDLGVLEKLSWARGDVPPYTRSNRE